MTRDPTQLLGDLGVLAVHSLQSRSTRAELLANGSIVFWTPAETLFTIVADVLPFRLRFAAPEVVDAVLVVPAARRVGRRLVHGGLLQAIEIDVRLAGAHVVNGVHVDPFAEHLGREKCL